MMPTFKIVIFFKKILEQIFSPNPLVDKVLLATLFTDMDMMNPGFYQ